MKAAPLYIVRFMAGEQVRKGVATSRDVQGSAIFENLVFLIPPLNQLFCHLFALFGCLRADMMKTEAMHAAQQHDADLVAESLGGNQEAFRKIVERHQTLICSLAYSATGSLSQSEDLAQETFVRAWQELAKLREPAKLRSWLCSIMRFLISKQLRQQDREPAHGAESMATLPESPAPEPLPSNQVINNEEKALLWRALELIPEIYREPLVLFYREHQSVEIVAQNLDLSEDAVKQRLSRGRKLLQEQVLAFVEGALERTNPGPGFTLGVLAAIPAMTFSAKAATLGAAAKGGAAATGAGGLGLLGAILCPLLAFLNLFVAWRQSHQTARSAYERRIYLVFYPVLAGSIVTMILLANLLMSHGSELIKTSPTWFVVLNLGLILGYPLLLIPFCLWFYRAVKKLALEFPPAAAATAPRNPVWEYRSRFELLGLPFIHLRSGGWQRGRPIRGLKPVKAWIAADDAFAFGVLFAYGAVAVAPISMGACALGLVSYAALSIGALSVGGFSFGWWAFGPFAFGWQAFGDTAIAWHAACGGQYAVARDLARAITAHAAQVNNELVEQCVKTNPFFRFCGLTLRPYVFWLMWLWAVPVMTSMMLQWRGLARRSETAAPQR